MKYITRKIWILSLVSLFTDTASEMLYPIMPIYLKSIGFSIVLIGILEGIAEATAGLSKGYFGKLSDLSGKRVPFIRWGYSFSAFSKPMMAIWTFPLWIFLARTMDKLGKGIRTGARDALLSDETSKDNKAKVFGFHRAMDTFGAVLGPSLALIFLHFQPENYKSLFFIAFIPGLFAIATTLALKENRKAHIKKSKTSFFSFVKYWKTSSNNYKKLVAGLLLFSLFNSSDVFLLLKLKDSGIDDTFVIGVYIFYNLVYAIFAFPAGIAADKLGLKKVFISGLILFSTVYFGMAFNSNIYIFLILFFLYGIYAASTEGVSKAWITNIVDKKNTATAIGTYTAFQSISTMIASSLAGIIWYGISAEMTLILTAIITILVVIYFAIIKI